MDSAPSTPPKTEITFQNELDAVLVSADPEVLSANRAGQLHPRQRVALTLLLWKMLGYGVLFSVGGGLIYWVFAVWQFGPVQSLRLSSTFAFFGVVTSLGSLLFFFQSFNLWRDLRTGTVLCMEGPIQPKYHPSQPQRRGRRSLDFHSVTVNKRTFYISPEVYATLRPKHYRLYYTPRKRLVFLEPLRR